MFLSRDNTQDDVDKVIIIYFFNLNENLSFHIIIKYLHMISHSIISIFLYIHLSFQINICKYP